MDRPALIVVPGDPPRAVTAARRPPRRRAVAGWAVGLALAFAVTALVGVDPVRRPIAAREIADETIQQSLAAGTESPAVREQLYVLRENLGRRPMDARTRVLYADLLLSLSRSLQETEAARAHAALAARQNPVTVPVVRRAALVFARAGATTEALELIRAMFGYDPGSAAELLLMLEPGVFRVELEKGIPPEPDAWLEWARRLRLEDRLDDAFDVASRAFERWPDNLPLLEWVALRAIRDGEWERLAVLLPPGAELPERREAAPVLLCRARLAAERGAERDAKADITRALALDPGSNQVHILAGDAYEALGDFPRARRHWNRALYELQDERAGSRRNLLTRLARLEDRHGRPSEALSLWESVLEIQPNHPEARRRVDELTAYER